MIAEAQTLCAGDSLVRINDNVFEILPEARPFARSIAARFDLYLGRPGPPLGRDLDRFRVLTGE